MLVMLFIGLLIFLISLFAPAAQAIMPQEVYARASRESHIKAIATIVDVKIIHVGKRATLKDASFQLEYALTDDTPATFIGSCESVDTPQQKSNIMVGEISIFTPKSATGSL